MVKKSRKDEQKDWEGASGERKKPSRWYPGGKHFQQEAWQLPVTLPNDLSRFRSIAILMRRALVEQK